MGYKTIEQARFRGRGRCHGIVSKTNVYETVRPSREVVAAVGQRAGELVELGDDKGVTSAVGGECFA